MMHMVMLDNAPHIEQFQRCSACHHGSTGGGVEKDVCTCCLRHYTHEGRQACMKDNFVPRGQKVSATRLDPDAS